MKQDTRTLHEVLDARMSPLVMRRNLGDFLLLQYRARHALEEWLQGLMDAPPPAQSPHIAEALHASGIPVPTHDLPQWECDPRGALGVAWLLAGSSLGNRSILACRAKAGLRGGESFLGNTEMVTYWTDLKARLEREYDAATTQHALAAAKQGFAHFLSLCETETDAMAAA